MIKVVKAFYSGEEIEIARWRGNLGAQLEDSSGNGHTLVLTGGAIDNAVTPTPPEGTAWLGHFTTASAGGDGFRPITGFQMPAAGRIELFHKSNGQFRYVLNVADGTGTKYFNCVVDNTGGGSGLTVSYIEAITGNVISGTSGSGDQGFDTLVDGNVHRLSIRYGALGVAVLVDGFLAIGFSNVPDTNWQSDPANTSFIVNEVDSGDVYVDDILAGDSTPRLNDSSGNGNHAFFMPGAYVVDNPEFPVPVPYGKRWFFSSLNTFGIASSESIGYPAQDVIPNRSNWRATVKAYFTGGQADTTYPFEYYRNNLPNEWAWLGFGYQQVGGPDPDLIPLDIVYSAGGSSFSYSTPVPVTPGPQEHEFIFDYEDGVLNIKLDGLDIAGSNDLHDLSAFDGDSVLDNYVQNSTTDAAILVDGMEFSTQIPSPPTQTPRMPIIVFLSQRLRDSGDVRVVFKWDPILRDSEGKAIDIDGYRIYRTSLLNLEDLEPVAEIITDDIRGFKDTIFTEVIAQGFRMYGVSAFKGDLESAIATRKGVAGKNFDRLE